MTHFLVQGAGSPELPLRLLNLLAQQGAIVTRAEIVLLDGDYRVLLSARTHRASRIVEKMATMVLVHSVETKEDCV